MLTKTPARAISAGIEAHRAIVEGLERRLDLAEALIDLVGQLVGAFIFGLELLDTRR